MAGLSLNGKQGSCWVWNVAKDNFATVCTIIAGHTFHVQDSKCLLDMPASNFGASRHDVLYAALILLYMKFEHALLCGDIVYLFDVDLSQMLNVYWPALHHSRSLLHQTAG